jgi:hypothetical protein
LEVGEEQCLLLLMAASLTAMGSSIALHHTPTLTTHVLLDAANKDSEDGGVLAGENYVRDKSTTTKSSLSAGEPGSPFVGMSATRIRLLVQAISTFLRKSATCAVPDAAAAIGEPAIDLSNKRKTV